jgi:hypothetical protein
MLWGWIQSAESTEPEETPLRTAQTIRPTQQGRAEHIPIGCAIQQLSIWAPHFATCILGFPQIGWRRHPCNRSRVTPGAGGQQPRPTSVRLELKGASPVDALQTILGEVLLALAGLAVVLLAVILVLAEAHLILRLSRKLTQSVSEEPGGR